MLNADSEHMGRPPQPSVVEPQGPGLTMSMKGVPLSPASLSPDSPAPTHFRAQSSRTPASLRPSDGALAVTPLKLMMMMMMMNPPHRGSSEFITGHCKDKVIIVEEVLGDKPESE